MQAIRSILKTDGRITWPNPTHLEAGDEIATVVVPKKHSGDIVRSAKTAGLATRVNALMALSSAHDLKDLVTVTIRVGSEIASIPGGALALLKMPAAFRQLQKQIRSRGRPATFVIPLLELDRLRPWLDAKYGAKKWRLDPDRLGAWRIQSTTLFVVYEVNSGARHLLAVNGEEVVELSGDWLPER